MKINNDIAPLVGYVILTVIFTYPVAFSSEEVFRGWRGWILVCMAPLVGKESIARIQQPP